ncbi:MAG: GNAT family N-acetyltransferase [Spirochaetales bacterium]|nr:GNAT family N-acetyltransferase [Spirochaetales bacterium]
MMRVSVHKSLKEIDPALWNSILEPDHIISSYEHLLAVEESNINDCEYRYTLCFDNGELVGHTCFYAISFDLDVLNGGGTKKYISLFRKIFYPEFLRIKVIECGTPAALGNTITIINGTNREKVLNLMIDTMEEFAREKKFGIILLRDFRQEDLPFFYKLKKRGFDKVNNLPASEVRIKWDTFENYIKDFKSHYRQKIKRCLKSIKAGILRIEIRDNFSDIAPRLHELWHHVYMRAKEYKREVLTPEFFINMHKYLGSKSRVALFHQDGIIVGFIFFLIDDLTLRPLFIGMDYNYHFDDNLYFSILYQSIKIGIEYGKKYVETGITTLNPKMQVGARMYPLYGFMKHISVLKNRPLTTLFKYLTPPYRPLWKHVFNKRYYERVYSDFEIHLYYDGHRCRAKGENLSEGGMFVSSPCPLKSRRKCKVEIQFPFNEEDIFIIPAKIIWSKELKSGHTAGLKFFGHNKTVREQIKVLLLSLKEKEENAAE